MNKRDNKDDKYEDTYPSCYTLKEMLGMEMNSKTYEEIYNYNIEVISEFLSMYYEGNKYKDDKEVRSIILSMYEDPDGSSIKNKDGIDCSADGLLSIRRIYGYEKATNKLVEDYKNYRKYPIFHFPQETNGINQTRSTVFGDRIDHTLFDIKNFYKLLKEYKEKKVEKDFKKYYDEQNDIKLRLINAFIKAKTFKFLISFTSFEEFIKWEFNQNEELAKIFVKIGKNDEYEVYDIEKNDGSIIEKHSEKYGYVWSKAYYNNIKQKIDKYNAIRNREQNKD